MEDIKPFAQLAGSSSDCRFDLVFIANESDLKSGIVSDSLDSTGHDWLGRVVAAHRVQRDPHGLLLGFGFDFQDFAALRIGPTALPANAVRQNRHTASAAILDIFLGGVMVTATHPLFRSGRTSLRNCHDQAAFSSWNLNGRR
jgi:hypothetical protein